jgi:hypothetical protein
MFLCDFILSWIFISFLMFFCECIFHKETIVIKKRPVPEPLSVTFFFKVNRALVHLICIIFHMFCKSKNINKMTDFASMNPLLYATILNVILSCKNSDNQLQ